MLLIKCGKCSALLEADGIQQPHGRVQILDEGFTDFRYGPHLRIESVWYHHCRLCESIGACRICNLECGNAVEFEHIDI